MPSRYDIYGFRRATLDDAVVRIQVALDVQLSERESGYYAGTYYRYAPSYGKGLKVYKNRDPSHGQFVRERYREYAVIVEVSDLDDMDGVQRKLTGSDANVVLLESKVLPDDVGGDKAEEGPDE
jgi:hypothetical protein